MEQSGKSGDQTTGGTGLAGAVEPDRLILADGKEYEMAALNLNILIEIEDILGMTLEIASKSQRLKMVRAVIFARLHARQSDLTIEQVGNLITPEIMARMDNILGEI